MKKHLLSIILLLCMVFALLPMSALAENDTVASGTCGFGLTWSLDSSGTLTISGTGNMTNYKESQYVPWDSNRTSIRTVVIDAGVDSIGDYAFCDCDNLMSITTCGKIDSIGDYAFYDCKNLNTASIVGKTSIGNYAFGFCSSLKTVAFNPTSIGNYAFFGCESLESIYLSYYNLTGITISDSAFQGVNAKVYYPEYSAIGYYYKEQFGKNMIFEAADHGYFGNVYWKYDNANKKLTISGTGSICKVSSGSETPWYAYSNLAPKDKQVKIIEVLPGITEIPSYCFEYMTSVTEIILPEGIKTFAPNSCNDCSSLNNLVIPSTVESFGFNDYFNRCDSLTDIFYVGTEEEWNKIPNAAQDMAYYPNQRVNFLKYNEPTATCTESGLEGYYAFDSSVVTGKYDANKKPITELKTVAPLGHDIVQHEAKAATCTEPGWEAYDTCTRCDYTTYVEIPALGHDYVNGICTHCRAVKVVDSGICGDNATWTLDSKGLLTISGSGDMWNFEYSNYYSTNIPWYSYRNEIKSVEIDDNITSIGDYAFDSCGNMKNAIIPDKVTSIGKKSFGNCYLLTEIEIPQFVNYIGDAAFDGAERLTAIKVNIRNKYYSSDGKGVLFNKDKSELIRCPEGYVGQYTIPDTVTVIGKNSFNNCDELSSVTIGSGVLIIDEYAFYECNITEISIPNNVREIGFSAFGYSNIQNVSMGNGLKNIGERAFFSCENLKDITIPDGITSIAKDTFYNCDTMVRVFIPSSVSSIGKNAFSYCDKLIQVFYGGCRGQWNAIAIEKGNSELIDSSIAYKDHKYSTDITPPTCTEQGYTKHTCPCGDSYIDGYVDATGHDTELINEKEATCTVAGYTGDEYCKNCGELMSSGEEIPALGHDYVDGVCTRCDVKDPTYVAITVQPGDISAVEGKTINFTVAAEGEGLSYQWQYSKNSGKTWLNSTSASATTDTISVKATAARDGQMYRCVITNANGNTVTSDAAKLSVIPASVIEITAQPGNISEVVGKTVCFKVTAMCDKELTYQWQYSKNSGKTWLNSTSASAVTDTISVKATATRDGQMYRCVITNADGSSVTSEAATLSIKTAVVTTITAQPEDYYGKANTTAKFEIEAEGDGLSYQWYYSTDDGETWHKSSSTGATTAVFEPALKSSTDGRIFRCQITDANGAKIYSETARMTIGTKPSSSSIEITAQPENASVAENVTAKFAVAAEGEGLTYQWQYSKNSGKSWLNSTSASAVTDTISVKATAARDGQMYRCIITDANGGSVTSNAVTLSVK